MKTLFIFLAFFIALSCQAQPPTWNPPNPDSLNISVLNQGVVNQVKVGNLTKTKLSLTKWAIDSALFRSLILPNNYVTSGSFTNNTLTLSRNGLSSITATIPLKDSADLLRSLIAAKQATITTGTTAQYIRGDLSLSSLTSTAVGLGNVDNTSDANKPVSTAQATAIGLKLNTADTSYLHNQIAANAAATANALGAKQDTSAKWYLSTNHFIGAGTSASPTDLKNVPDSLATAQALATKQATLVSGTNIKTINGTSILGSGNITISGGTGGGITGADSAYFGTDKRLHVIKDSFDYRIAIIDSAPYSYVANAEARAYFTAAGITNKAFKTAWDNFVTGGKLDGFYSKFPAFYPLPGASATQNRYDAITATLLGAYSGTVTVSSTGDTYDGSSGYFDQGIAASAMSQNGLGMFTYLMTAMPVGGQFGSRDGASNEFGAYVYKNTSTSYLPSWNSATNGNITFSASTGIYGFFRTDASTIYGYLGTTQQGTSTTTSNTPNSQTLYMGALHTQYGPTGYSAFKTGGFGVMNNFTTTDWTNFATRYQTFLTAIGR